MSKLKKIQDISPIYFIRANKTKFGGAEVYLSRLSIELNKKKIDYKILNSYLPKFLPSWFRVIFFDYHLTICKRNKFYFSLDRVSFPDIYRAGDGVHREFLKTQKKSTFNPLHPTYLYLEKKCFNNAKSIIVNSLMVKRQIVENYNISPEKIKLVRNGINIKKINFNKSFEKLSKEFSIKSEAKIIGYVGSGFKRKGVKEFIQIISMLKNENILAFVVGKDNDLNYYVQISKNYNLENKIIFTGPREDVDDFYTICDIFLFPTHYEPFSNVVLEAMSFKTAVYTTKQNGASEILDSRFVMQSPGDFSVVNDIETLLENETKLKMIKNQNRVQSKKYTIEKSLEGTLKVINETIN